MAGFMRHLSQRVPILRNSGAGDAHVVASDLTNSSEVLINSLSGDTANQMCSNVVSEPVSVEPIGAMPCSVDVPACSSEGVNSIVASEADECQTACSRRHRRHRRSRRHRLCRIKCKEVNFMSVMCCIIVVVLICTSLYEPHWWYIGSSHCRDSQLTPVVYLSVRPFFFEGFFMAEGQQQSAYYYGSSETDVLRNCVTPRAVHVIKSIVILCFVVIIFNVAAIVLDVVLFTSRITKALRNYAIFSILSVCTCVTINLLSYVVTQQLSTYYQSNPSLVFGGNRVDVEFSLCFYVIMASGVVSVIAVASSLLCRHGSGTCCVTGSSTSRIGRRRRDERLIDNDNNQLYRSFLGDPSLPALPPPYEP